MVKLFGEKLKYECDQETKDGEMVCSAKRGEEVVAKFLAKLGPDGEMRIKNQYGEPKEIDRLEEWAQERIVLNVVKKKGKESGEF